MNERWTQGAERIVDALGVQRGELIQVRDYAQRYDVLEELMLAVERRGATPLPQILPTAYLRRLLATSDIAALEQWDQHRRLWAEATDRAIILAGTDRDLAGVPPHALTAWLQAIARLEEVETRRCIPTLLAAIPNEAVAHQLGLSLDELEAIVLPALSVPPETLEQEVYRVVGSVEGSSNLELHTGTDSVLYLDRGQRRWLPETGALPDPRSRQAGIQVVMNMPSGSIYSTVVETATHGFLSLPHAAGARNVILHFEGGRIIKIEAEQGGEELEAMFDSHSGEPRRISHIGIGLNPQVQHPIGWVLVDEHCYGAIFVAFGENRYLGGENASSLNIDVTIRDASMLVDGKPIVLKGKVVK